MSIRMRLKRLRGRWPWVSKRTMTEALHRQRKQIDDEWRKNIAGLLQQHFEQVPVIVRGKDGKIGALGVTVDWATETYTVVVTGDARLTDLASAAWLTEKLMPMLQTELSRTLREQVKTFKAAAESDVKQSAALEEPQGSGG